MSQFVVIGGSDGGTLKGVLEQVFLPIEDCIVAKNRSHGEGTIYQRPNGTWAAQITLPSGKRKTKYAKSQKALQEWLVGQRRALAEGTFVVDSKTTLGEFLQRWYADVAAHRLRPSTLITHESVMRVHILPALGSVRLSQLTPAHLQAVYAEKLKAGYSKRTVKYIHTMLHQALGQAMRWGLVARNVSEAVESPVPAKRPVEPLSLAQVRALLNVLKGERLYAFYVLALGTGLRRGELLGLTLACVDLEEGTVHVKKSLLALKGQGLVLGEPKSESSRRPVALPEFARQALAEHLALRDVASPYVFCTSRGTPYSPRNVVRHFKAALKRAGLPRTIRLHDLRHTFVSFLLAQNVPPKDVQEIAGHASFATTMDIYGHLMLGARREAAKKMDRLFGEGDDLTAEVLQSR